MSKAITVEGVGKRYFLGEGHGQGGRMSRQVDILVAAPFRRLFRRKPPPVTDGAEFWALRDVSLELDQGRMLGLIGANGAGKSTLLKLLARVTTPTEGRITLRGQVGSLLEVGTGFHQELTGRENIYLNGAILGMRRREISRRFDEIVEFSGIEHFIDTPVKRYSSGMFVRLAFSVAAHLQPEILLVDEVLAVGDAEFQKKCLDKLEEVRRDEGRTIVFCSHGLSSVRKLCDRAVLIEEGRVRADGPAEEVVADYMDRVRPSQHGGVTTVPAEIERDGSGEARVVRVSLLDDAGEPIGNVLYGQPFTVAIEFDVAEVLDEAVFWAGLSSADETPLITSSSTDFGGAPQVVAPGRVEVRVKFDVTLLPGEFALDVGVSKGHGTTIDGVERVMTFSAERRPWEGEDRYPWETVVGYVRPDAQWVLPTPIPATPPEPSRTAG